MEYKSHKEYRTARNKKKGGWGYAKRWEGKTNLPD